MTPVRAPLTGLTGIRYFAAFHVVLFHLGYNLFDTAARPLQVIAKTGYVGVSFFFILSGFVLAYNYDRVDRPMQRAERRDFWVKRYARVFPLYLLSLLAIASLDVPELLRRQSHGQALLHVLLHLTMTSSWYPAAATTWNYPSWSIADEAFFYAMFPLAAYWLRSGRRPAVLLGMAAMWLLSVGASFAYLAADPDHIGTTINLFYRTTYLEVLKFSPIVRLPEFLMGILLARLRFHPAARARPLAWWVEDLALLGASAAIYVGLSASVDHEVVSIVVHNAGLAPLFCVVIACLANGQGCCARVLSCRPLTVLGEASYSFYLLQIPLAMHFFIQPWTASLPRWGVFAAYVTLLTAVAVASHYLVERPARTLVVGWLRPRGGDPSGGRAAGPHVGPVGQDRRAS